MADYPFNESVDYVKPSLKIREKALEYKSKRLFTGSIYDSGSDSIDISRKLKSLKDSLSQGKCFSLGLNIYEDFEKLTVENNVYSCYKETIYGDSYGHALTIVGYNDTIKTAEGRGAFQVINSYEQPAGGHLYLDYNWFYFMNSQVYTYYFLEEDFISQPKTTLIIDLSESISGQEVAEHENLFVDTVLNYSGKKVDVVSYSEYLCGVNQIQITNVNGQRLKMRAKTVLKPLNNSDGNYELISDLSDLVSVSDFKSVSVIVFDPISATYIGADDQIFYSYTREPKLSINKAYLDFLGTDKKVIAKVEDLSDTTIIFNDFYSVVAGLNLKPFQYNIYVKTCTSVLKRKLITFSVEDLAVNLPLAFTQVPSDAEVVSGNTYNFKVIALDPENTPIVYSMVSGLGGTINSTTGQFTFLSDQVGDFPFTVKASDGFYSITTTFNVKVTEIIVVKPLEFTKTLPDETIVAQTTLFSFRFEASGPNQPLTFSGADNYSPDHFTVSLNQTTGDFTFISHATVSGKFIFKITVSDGVSSISTLAIIIVKPASVNTAPTFITTPGTLMTYTNKTLDYQFEASDSEGDPLTFSILNSLPEAQLTSSGALTFVSANANTYTFTVVVSDGQASTSLVVSVKVDFNVAVETIIEPDYSISIYPNPVSDNTNIKISMKKRSKINLSIYDLQGRQIDLVANTEYEAGENTISYDASNLKSGAYICRLVAANFSKSIKIVKQ